MTDHMTNRNAQRESHQPPTEPLKQDPDLEAIVFPPEKSIDSRARQTREGVSGRVKLDRRHPTKRRHANTNPEIPPLPLLGNDSQLFINEPSLVASLPSHIPSHKSSRKSGPKSVEYNKLSERVHSAATSTGIQMNPVRLFIASLGNPPPYSSTRHSAGHILIKALQSYLSLPSFAKSKVHGNGLTSLGAEIGRSEYTLWQSPSLMNVSGAALLKAYKAHVAAMQDSPTDPMPGLVILYDEMETAPSQLKVRRGATSAKGHNGVKSVQQSLQSAGLMDKLGDRFVKIGVGIGRPASGSRSSDDVSEYVLGQLTAGERQGIDGKVPELVKLLEQEMVRMSK